MVVSILGPATTAAQTFIADREARLRRERQIVAGFEAAQRVVSAPVSERARLAIIEALELAGLGRFAELIAPIFATLDIGPKRLGPQTLLRDLITTGTLPAEKIRRLEEKKPIDLRRLAVRLQEWGQEIVAPGTGQPVIAKFGILPEERGRLQPVTPTLIARVPPTLADGSPVLELRPTSQKSFIRRLERAPLKAFQRTAAGLRRLAERRGLL